MALSVLDLFSVGIGPSSSHTVGPMRAAKLFADGLKGDGHLSSTRRVQAELFGSLGATGRGHGSDKAVVLGFKGLDPETVDTSTADDQVAAAALDAELWVCGDHRVDFNWDEDVVLHRRKSLPAHPNGMTFRALDHAGTVLSERSFYSIGGGFVVDGDADAGDRVVADATVLPYPFSTADELLEICQPRRHVHLRRDARQRTDLAQRSGTPGEAAGAVGGHARMRGQRLRRGRDPSGRPERQAPGAVVVPDPDGGHRRDRSAPGDGMGEPVRAGRQRGKRRRRPHRHRTHQRRGRHRPRGAALLREVRSRRQRRRRGPLPAGRGRRRNPVQDQRLHLRRRSGLPGRGGFRLLHGGRRASARSSAARPSRWRTPPRWASNTTSA